MNAFSRPLLLSAIVVATAVLVVASLVTGGGYGWSDVLTMEGDGALVLAASRVPRTLALLLSGAGLAVSGILMQMIARNRFVEPSTAGTVEAASLGILLTLLLMPGAPVIARMLVAALVALAGSGLFLMLLGRLPLGSALMVPLVGIMLGGIFEAVTSFLAYRFDLLQSLGAFGSGDFSIVLRGRYEFLWIIAGLVAAAYATAARFTILGMGEAVAIGVGLNYRRLIIFGLIIVSVVTAAVVVTVGAVPFVGLIVPNVVSLLLGDDLRRSLPVVAAGGALLVLASDIAGRLVIAPYEIPVGTIMGVVGSLGFLMLIFGRRSHAA
ncbi:iron chelate uptake ABC transporter family permease subunit [Pleomorphomonas carboxyditropha]|uniref:iron chelate uptake ABC transporter family permease subunit n=1 Tax=Pleomorphomonas carboxyditropha TaxID=2023338 RepID=UPI0024781E30|nr:iron chelate uptake ABC transporter family permease subunit [Pleomorphomonas carboxyditropha]